MSERRTRVKRVARRLIDRGAHPYVETVLAGVAQRINGHTATSAETGPDASARAVALGGTSDAFHLANHALRTVELERVPKGARRALSVGAQGRWYFDWFERSVGTLEEHIGVEAYEPKPDDLPPYATWVADTADHMVGVADASVDLVFAGQTSEHLWADELTGFLMESHRVLTPGGILALDSPNRLITEHLRWSHGGHTIELSATEMSELLDLAGFEVRSVAGIWNCRVDGRVLQLEEGIDDAAVFARRAATARDNPDDSFVWWINARRRDVEPKAAELRSRVDELFDAHWNTRVSRGLFPEPGATSLVIDQSASGKIAQSMSFLLPAGRVLITATLAEGSWESLHGFGLRIVSPGDHMIQDLPLAWGTIDGASVSWDVGWPTLFFALAFQVLVDRVDAPVSLQLPIDVRVHRTVAGEGPSGEQESPKQGRTGA